MDNKQEYILPDNYWIRKIYSDLLVNLYENLNGKYYKFLISDAVFGVRLIKYDIKHDIKERIRKDCVPLLGILSAEYEFVLNGYKNRPLHETIDDLHREFDKTLQNEKYEKYIGLKFVKNMCDMAIEKYSNKEQLDNQNEKEM